MAQVLKHLCVPLVKRSWNAVSLFGSDVRCPLAATRHARKMRTLGWGADGADVILIQETRGREADIVELGDILPGWEFVGSVVNAGVAGGSAFGISPRPRTLYERATFAPVRRLGSAARHREHPCRHRRRWLRPPCNAAPPPRVALRRALDVHEKL